MLMRVFEVIRPENIEFILFCFLEQTSKRHYDCQAKIIRCLSPGAAEMKRQAREGLDGGNGLKQQARHPRTSTMISVG
jgi:hypothetical protein